jgi:hypothetical protein
MSSFLHYRSVFEMSVFHSNLLSPNLRNVHSAQVTQDGGNKLPATIFDSNFLLFVCRLERAPWQVRMASGLCAHVFELKVVSLEIVRFRGFNSQQRHIAFTSSFLCIYTYIFNNCDRQQTLGHIKCIYLFTKEFVEIH